MQYRTALFCLCLFITTGLQAQYKYLEGYWKGYITNTISEHAKSGMTFELYLKTEGKNKVVGRSYAYREDGEIIEMAVKGTIHSDRSVSLYDASYLPLENSDVLPTHNKKYQFDYYRSVFQTHNKLTGFWQEIIDKPDSVTRKRGKVILKKVNNTTNKA